MSKRVALAVLVALAVTGTAGAAGAFALPGAKTAADRAAWRKLLHWPAACEQDWKTSNPQGAGLTLWTTESSSALVGVDCYLGAYQGVTMFFLVDARGATSGPLSFRIYEDTKGNGHPRVVSDTRILGDATFTPSAGRLAIFDKYRGPADCGIYSVFRLSDDGFVPVSVNAKEACDGKPPYDPSRWPRLRLPT